jgi:ABC-type uncharacterized transport system auxiliary subunit
MTLKLASFVLGASLLSGCVSVLPEPVGPDALYEVEATQDLSGLAHDLIVREPEAPRLMAGQGMVSEGADGGLRLIAGVEWSGPATRQIQLAMIDSFKTGEVGNAVLPELGVLADYELASQLSVLRLEGETAVCKMVVSLIETQGRSLLARRDILASEQASGGGASSRATALKTAASDCAMQASAFAIEQLQDVD